MALEIDYLAHYRPAIPMLAQWHHEQWHYLAPAYGLEARTSGLRQLATEGGIPTTFVAVSGGEVVGSASLVEKDLRTHPELRPWLAAVYVEAGRRSEGIGTALVRRVMTEAQSVGERTLYLFTPDRAGFYERLGWQEMFREEYGGEEQVIMSVDLDHRADG